MPLNLSTIQSVMYLGQIMEPKSSQASSKPQGVWKTEKPSKESRRDLISKTETAGEIVWLLQLNCRGEIRGGINRLEGTEISTISSYCVWMLFGIQSKQKTIIFKKKRKNRNSDNEPSWYYEIIYLHFLEVKLVYNVFSFCYMAKWLRFLIHIYIYMFLSMFFSIMVPHRILNIVPYAIQ